MESSDILARLRHATSERHALLDQGMPLAAQAPTLQHYRDHLILLRRWLEPIEAWQAGFADGPQGCDALPRLPHVPLIDIDLGHETMPAGVHDAAASIQWNGENTVPYRWGVSYVIEGSRLGGHVLRRRLAERLAPHPLRYLGDASQTPGPRWNSFIEALRSEVRDSDAIDQACSGACDAFDHLIALLDQRKTN